MLHYTLQYDHILIDKLMYTFMPQMYNMHSVYQTVFYDNISRGSLISFFLTTWIFLLERQII